MGLFVHPWHNALLVVTEYYYSMISYDYCGTASLAHVPISVVVVNACEFIKNVLQQKA